MSRVVLLKMGTKSPGGLEKYTKRIACGFAAKGAEVTVLTTGQPQSLIGFPQITSHSCQLIRWPSFLRLEQFDRFTQDWLKKEKADVVFGMERNRFQTHLRAGNGVHAAYLKSRLFTEGKLKQVLFQINPLHRKILQLEKEGFEHPGLQKLFTNSHKVKAEILEYYATDPKKIEVVHNGVEWQEMRSAFEEWPQKRSGWFSQLQLDPASFQFLFIANGYRRKGLDLLLKALALLPQKDWQLSIVGKDKRIGFYQELVQKLNLEKQVFFFGLQPKVLPFYQMADCLVIPSFYDPFANVTVEALAMGLFVVSSKENGGSEILKEENGTIIPDLQRVDALVESLQIALQFPKTPDRSSSIRNSVAYLDFSKQLPFLFRACGYT